jgi:hypothetical protein
LEIVKKHAGDELNLDQGQDGPKVAAVFAEASVTGHSRGTSARRVF